MYKESTVKDILSKEYEPTGSGRGIVTCGGGRQYFVNAYLLVKLLRYVGCTLPIEWNYLSNEMDESMLKIASSLDCSLIERKTATKYDSYYKQKGAWQAKIKCILGSSFREVMWLDADCFPVRDPQYLFHLKEYKEHGALFWPDISSWTKQKWKILESWFGVSFLNDREFESGQLLVNKDVCMKALKLVEFYNDNSDDIYKVVFGDKDTFYFSFRISGTPYNVIKTAPAFMPAMLIQHDPTGYPLLRHCTGHKWVMSASVARLTDDSFPFKDLFVHWIEELRWKWKPFRETLEKGTLKNRYVLRPEDSVPLWQGFGRVTEAGVEVSA